MASANGQPMECETVESRLLDLVYGELGDPDAQTVRAHLDDCEACGRVMARLESGRAVARKMELAEPPPALLDAVRAAARAKAGEAQRAVARAHIAEREVKDARPSARARAAERGDESSWWSEVLRRLRSIATGPQVAMATLLILMVGIGLWSAPRLSNRGEHGTSVAVLEPDPDGEIGPSAALEPAERLQLGVDPRTGRIVPVEEPTEAPGAPERAAEPRVRPEPPMVAERDGVEVAPAEERRTARAEVQEEALHRAQPSTEGSGDDAVAAYEMDLEPGEAVGMVEQGPLPEATSAGGSGSAAVASTERASSPQPQVVQRSMPQPVARGAAEGVAPPQVDTTTALASGLHQQARAAASAGRYADCVGTSQQVLDRYPTYAQTGRVLIDMAECQRRMGNLAVAERTLERAQRFAVVRADAERELSRIRMMREPPDRAAASQAAPASE